MLKHLEQVLTAAGLPEDQVKQLVELPEDAKEFKPDTFVTPLTTTIETKVKNDPKFYEGLNKENLPKEFLKQLESEQYGRSANEVRQNMMKALGFKEDDFKDLGDEFKKIPVFSTAFVKKLTEGKVTDKELQQKLIEATNKVNEFETKIPELEKTIEAKYATKLNEEKSQFVVLAGLAQVPGLTAPPAYIADKVTAKLRDKYDIVIDGTEAKIRQKGKPDLLVLVDNKELTFHDAITAIVTADGLVKQDKKVDTKTGKVTVEAEPQEGEFKLNSHVNDKMAKRLEQDKKAAGEK